LKGRFESCVTAVDLDIFDADNECFFCSHDSNELFRSSNSCINEIAGEHFEMARMDWHHDDRGFTPLIFVDGNGIRERKLIEF